ncbi:MAG: hypothetical protein LUD71_05790, partial [Clostridiales bacterium]|nr:hypothetical protein [Clostridiales bacterium]
VVEHLAARYETVKEGVRSVMGGKVLEYEAKTIYREGMEQGERQTKKIFKLYASGRSLEEISEECQVPVEKIQEILN